MAECIEKDAPTELTFRLTKKEVEVIRQLVGKASPADAKKVGCSMEMLDDSGCTLDHIYNCFNTACDKYWSSTIRPTG